jgi:hypothetical protein
LNGSAILFLSASLAACAHDARVKIYLSKPEAGGLVRAQADEFISYKDSGDYMCISPEGAEILISEMGEK